jgi:hypothetical protein
MGVTADPAVVMAPTEAMRNNSHGNRSALCEECAVADDGDDDKLSVSAAIESLRDQLEQA